jgi:ArsR family transcriptional regulator, arsenate/arsenite/antimonite-responsive transcriptional repressor
VQVCENVERRCSRCSRLLEVARGARGARGAQFSSLHTSITAYTVGCVATPLLRSAPLFAALADPNRLAIVDRLRLGERCVTDLCEDVGAGQSLISFHLKALRDVGLVFSRREGRTVWYALDPSGLARLDRLVRHLRGEKQSREEASRAAELDICMEYINDR